MIEGRGKRDKNRRSITNQADIEEDMNKDENMNDEGTAVITEEGIEEVVDEGSGIAKQDGKIRWR